MALLQLKRAVLLQCLFVTVLLVSAASFVAFTFYNTAGTLSNSDSKDGVAKNHDDLRLLQNQLRENIQEVEEKIKINNEIRTSVKQGHINATMQKVDIAQNDNNHPNNESDVLNIKQVSVNYNVHVFYYPWYKNEKVDGKYAHWNHELIPHWNDKQRTRKRQHVPPDDIGANFYPKLGPYSSSDPEIIDAHMKQIVAAGSGVLAVSWYPPQHEKTSETPVDDMMMKLFDGAAKYGLKIAFHIEPYEDRSGKTLREVIEFVINKYGNHSAFYRTKFKGRDLPVYYVYDSYQIKATEWASALTKDGKFSLRNTPYDGIFLGLLVENNHFVHLSDSGFDGFYTYFASSGFVYGSAWQNWPEIAEEANKRNLLFVPSIGPGYVDTRVRPWNGQNTRLRINGRYYRNAFNAALAVKPPLLTVTSFNEWHEGTQIEPAIPKTISGYKYEDYRPNTPEFYLNLTRQFAEEYRRNMTIELYPHKHTDTL